MSNLSRLLFATLISCFAFTGAVIAQERYVPQDRSHIQYSFAPIVKRTAPSVVNVYAKQMVAQDGRGGLFNDPFFRQFFGDDAPGLPQERVTNSLGSGVIVDRNGLIVTNNHVVKNGVDIRVALADKREFSAKVLLADERTDLAVLKIDVGSGEALPALQLANSDDLEVGDLVLAIGNPFGVGQTVTSGIVSALARTEVGISDYQFFIQTDAAINPGNSGGALVNMDGQLVGINTAIFSRGGGSIGIGFSIPTNMVRTVVQSAQLGTKIKRPWLGGSFQNVTAEIADSLGFARPEGALVVALHPQSPLATAGLRRGDVITAIDDKIVENASELGYRAATARLGQSQIVEYHRGQKTYEAQVRMIAAPEVPPRNETNVRGNTPLAGAVVANLSPAVADELDLSIDAKGVVVTSVKDGAAIRFLRKGDVLVRINGFAIKDVDGLRGFLSEQQDYWDIELLRAGKALQLRLG
jgi:Do/DeqQ family serine protease